MRKWLAMLRPNPWLTRRLLMLGVLVGVAVAAFSWGRHGAVPEVDGQPPPVTVKTQVTATPGLATDDYSRRVVAYVYDNIPIMREELGEYLIARFGKERIEFLINRKLVEMACKSQGIVITDAEVEAQLVGDVKSFGAGMTLDGFVNQVLKRFNKTLYEWREDVIRPKLAMTALVKPLIKVTPADVEKEFESRYGPKVQCRIIVLPDAGSDKAMRTANEKVWQHASQSEAAFKEEAGKQFIPELKAHEGQAPPIFKHCSEKALEETAFRLQEGQTSGLIQASDKTWFILRCEKHLLPDSTKRIENERFALGQEVFEKKLAAEIPQFFERLRQQAHPRNLLFETNPLSPALSVPKMVSPAAN
jgi:hypothetical protein